MSYLQCPGCNKFTETKVTNNRKAIGINGLRRRRECLGCGIRYSTVEQIVPEGKRGYPDTKLLHFEEDYQHEEHTDDRDSPHFKYRVRNRQYPGPNSG